MTDQPHSETDQSANGVASQSPQQGRRSLLDESCPLTKGNLDRVRALRGALTGRGYPILAIHSPWPLVTDAHGKRGAAGKQPKASPDKKSWTDPSQAARQPAELLKVTKICANTGMAMGLPALGHDHAFYAADLDIDDRARAGKVLKGMAEAGGLSAAIYQERRAPLRVRHNSGRLAVIFRAPPGVTLEILPSIVSDWGKLDFLGRGRQLVIDGWHDSGMDGSVPIVCVPSLADLDPASIAVVTEAQLAVMHSYALATLPGARISDSQPKGGASPHASPRRARKSAFTPETPVTLAELLIIAHQLPNEIVGYDDWKAAGMAFFAASGGAEHGLFAWTVWSCKIDEHVANLDHKNSCEGEWEKMRGSPPTATSMGALVERVRRALNNPDWSVGHG